MASWRVESDAAHLDRLVDPLKMSSLLREETDIEPKREDRLANVGRRQIYDQLEPIPPPAGELCIFRKHSANVQNVG